MRHMTDGKKATTGCETRKIIVPKGQLPPSNCESCEHYDYDEEWDEYVCKIDLDEDEMMRFLSGNCRACPYYKYYDEYKSVQKQN